MSGQRGPTPLVAAAWLAASVSLHASRGLIVQSASAEGGRVTFSKLGSGLVTEAVKLLICLGFTCSQVARRRRPAAGGGGCRDASARWNWWLCLPGAMYAAENMMYLVAIEKAGSAVMLQLLGSLEIVLVGGFAVLVLGRSLTAVQWISLLLICSSVAAAELASCGDCSDAGDFRVDVLLLVLPITLVASLAGTLTEKYLKAQPDVHILEASTPLYLSSTACIAATALVAETRDVLSGRLFTQLGWLGITYVAATVAVGLLAGLIMKLLSNVVKTLALTTTMFVTALASWALLGQSLSTPFLLSMVNVACGIALYKTGARSGRSDVAPLRARPTALAASAAGVELVQQQREEEEEEGHPHADTPRDEEDEEVAGRTNVPRAIKPGRANSGMRRGYARLSTDTSMDAPDAEELSLSPGRRASFQDVGRYHMNGFSPASHGGRGSRVGSSSE